MNENKILIPNIMNCLLSSTEANFQRKLATIISIICKKEFNLEFRKIQPTNGDGKNDGWIPAKNIFFAMYSPNDNRLSQINQINNKLNKDLDGLCDNLYNKKFWSGKLSEFYLIVNTHDKDLPADVENLLDKTIESIKEKYKQEFKAQVIAATDIREYLYDLSSETIKSIADNLNIYDIISDFNIPDIFKFIDEYNEFLVTKHINHISIDYSRIKIEEKIDINNLNEKKEHILNLIEASDKIDEYLKFINDEGLNIDKYLKLKNYIIERYNFFKDNYKGTDLYTQLLGDLIYENLPDAYARILEAVIINTFIKCDIFEKGEKL